MKAYVLINVRAGKAREVVEKVRQIEGIKQANACWGRPDVFALRASSGVSFWQPVRSSNRAVFMAPLYRAISIARIALARSFNLSASVLRSISCRRKT